MIKNINIRYIKIRWTKEYGTYICPKDMSISAVYGLRNKSNCILRLTL